VLEPSSGLRMEADRAHALPLAHARDRSYPKHASSLRRPAAFCLMWAPTPGAPSLARLVVGSPLPHLHGDWAHPCRVCTGTRLAAATSAPGPALPSPAQLVAASALAAGRFRCGPVGEARCVQPSGATAQSLRAARCAAHLPTGTPAASPPAPLPPLLLPLTYPIQRMAHRQRRRLTAHFR
jgi:hypothetical protein